MAETLTFADFDPGLTNLPFRMSPSDHVYDIGGGAIPEMASAFDYDLTDAPNVENLGGLIAAVGPAKELRENIDGVQEALGTNDEAIDIARRWVKSTGLLTPVSRSFYNPRAAMPFRFDAAIITGGVRNWMSRRSTRLEQFMAEKDIDRAYFVAGNRVMKEAEGPDVVDGMTEADYFEQVTVPSLGHVGLDMTVIRVDSGVGDEVMAKAAEYIDPDWSVVNVSNAGAWVQNVGQLRRAIIDANPDAFFDSDGDQLFVVSDAYPLGVTGEEPPKTHQNPYTALGQIARNAQEFQRHIG